LCLRGAFIGKGPVKEVRNRQKSLQPDRFGKPDRGQAVAVHLVARSDVLARKFRQRGAHLTECATGFMWPGQLIGNR
jgi:hypothetical protein